MIEMMIGGFVGIAATFTSMWIAGVELVFKEKREK